VHTGVIVPVHGWAPLLAETLDAIFEQDPRPELVVVVDDGSPERLELHPDHAGECVLVRHDECRGLAAARATGLSQLDTELVALCDDDDAWEAGKHAAQLAALAEHPDAAVCVGHAQIVGLDGRPTGERWDELPAGLHPADELRALLYERNPLCVSSALLRRDALLAVGGFAFPLPRAEDWDLWLRLLGAGHAFVMEPRAVVRYRRKAGALSGDIAGLASAQMHVHELHAGLVGEQVRRRVEAADRAARARGLVRDRSFAAARSELGRAAELGAPSARDRALGLALAVPGARAALGRRDPYVRAASRLERWMRWRPRPRPSKDAAELAYWRERAAQEGTLGHDHYERVFTDHFELTPAFFAGKRVLDVGCGPRGSLEWADGAAERVGLDPLVDRYRELGIDRHAMRYVSAPAEHMPLPDASFDIVATLNSLDHVDDIDGAVAEITRVAAPGATWLLTVEVGHVPTATEPHALEWNVVEEFAGWQVEWSARNGLRGDHDIYASIDEGLAYVSGPGLLRARLRRGVHL